MAVMELVCADYGGPILQAAPNRLEGRGSEVACAEVLVCRAACKHWRVLVAGYAWLWAPALVFPCQPCMCGGYCILRGGRVYLASLAQLRPSWRLVLWAQG